MSDPLHSLAAIRLTSSLGDDLLDVEGFHAEEEISRPYLWTVDLASDDREVAIEGLLRTPVLLTCAMSDESELLLHGVVRRARQTGVHASHGTYQIEIVPAFWFASLSRNVRIFQNLTARDIVETVLKEAGIADFRFDLTDGLPTRDYCVQYRESDFDFVSRLLEAEGIHYYFVHEERKHTLVMSDRVDLAPAFEGGKLPVLPSEHDGSRGLRQVSLDHGVHPGSVELRDYDFEQAPAPLRASVTGEGPEAVVDYHPGRFRSRREGDRWARIELEREEGASPRLHGEGCALELRAGHRFDLEGHPRGDANDGHVVLRAHHRAWGFGYRSTEGAVEAGSLTAVEAVPFRIPWRPPLLTPRPRIAGYQTAMVVGKSGEEIWVDRHGRVKVRFHWDHWADSDDENASCWVRVSTTWAGKQWGALQLPRVGEEVIVGFLEGDPDQPIIVGRVYNDDRKPPYPLPDEKTKSGVRSRSSKNGDAQTFNEIRFEDLKGKEELYIHAERNHLLVVENDRTERIGHDSVTEVTHDRTATIEKNESLTVGEDRTATVGGKEEITVGKDRSRSVGGEDSLTVTEGRSTSIGRDDALTAGQKVKVTAGTSITLEAGTTLTLKVGSNKIEISQSGITIKAAQVGIQATGGVNVKGATVEVNAKAVAKVEGTMTSVKGKALLELQGGLTKIN
jgi:type VI secretion system secreted protein VgrG